MVKSLKTKAEFRQAFKGKRINHKYFAMIATENRQETPRLGMAIAKKHYKKACDRNLIKRIIRDQFRQNVHKSVDVVFLSRFKGNLKDRAAIHQAVYQLLSKL